MALAYLTNRPVFRTAAATGDQHAVPGDELVGRVVPPSAELLSHGTVANQE